MNPFDFVNAINFSKSDLITENPSVEKEYQPFLINKALSYFPDTIFHANNMNSCSNIDKKLQFDYYLHSISKKKRFSKWIKPADNVDIDNIKKVYGYSTKRANEALSVLSRENLDIIAKLCDTGGVKK